MAGKSKRPQLLLTPEEWQHPLRRRRSREFILLLKDLDPS